MSSHSRFSAARPALIAIGGVAFGGALIWLTLRGVDLNEARAVVDSIRPEWVVAAILIYVLAMATRVARWRTLLNQLCPGAGTAAIAETLVVGYAVNYIVPARLGELFRADYAKRRLRTPRTAVLGSIVVERTLDGLTVVGMLSLGLAWATLTASAKTVGALWALQWVAGAGALVFVGLVIALALTRWLGRRQWRLPDRVTQIIHAFTDGVRTLNRTTLLKAGSLTVSVWMLEAGAFWLMARAAGVAMAPDQALVLIGAASLSTLAPTAPGFLGSFQFVFALIFAAFGTSEAVGVVTATALQLFLFGGVTLTGLSILLVRWVVPAARLASTNSKPDDAPFTLAAPSKVETASGNQ